MHSRFPYTQDFVIEDEVFSADEINDLLLPLILERRCERIAAVIPNRTYTVTPVMEGLCDRGNVSAVLRSAESMGYQSVHIIDTTEEWRRANRVTQGADKWLDINRWESTGDCITQLKKQGYKVVATHLAHAKPIESLDFTQPTALVFGNEHAGVSEELLELADERMVIPMLGFVQSFNISVAAALSLYHARMDRMARQGHHGDLTEEEQYLLTTEFYRRSVMKGDEVLLRSHGKEPKPKLRRTSS